MLRNIRGTGGAAALVACLAATAFAAPEQDDDVRIEMERLRAEMRTMEERHRSEMEALRAELATRDAAGQGDLASEIDRLMDRVDGLETQIATDVRRPGAFRLVDVSLNALMAAGGSGEDDETIEALQSGGHDPNRRGFTVQNVELILKGAVDPYFTAQANIVWFTDRDGESQFELEEAFAQTTSLPWGLQARAGQFSNAFGRHNPQHPHQWDFVDMPFGWTRFLGPDGMRGAGAELSWLLPVDTPIEILGAVQNANGETMSSFVGAGGEEDAHDHGHAHGGSYTFGEPRGREVRSLDDLVWSGRGTVSLDLSDEWTALLGSSVAYGPNSAGRRADTWLSGVDLTARWTPLDNRRGFPFVDVRFEYLARDYEYDAFTDEAGDVFRSGSLNDETWYLQSTWGFATDWTLGARYEDFSGDSPEEILGLEDRDRWSVAITHYFSEFSKIRLQLNRDDSDVLGDATSVWLQLEFNLGAHGAHEF